MSIVPNYGANPALLSTNTIVQLGHGCLDNVPDECYVLFVRVSDSNMIDSLSVHNQIQVLAMYKTMLEESNRIGKNLPTVTLVDVVSSHDYPADERLCARLLSCLLVKPGRVVVFATPERLTRRWSEMEELVVHCFKHGVPLYSAIPLYDAETSEVHRVLFELDPTNKNLMHHLHEYMKAEFTFVQSASDRNHANHAVLAGSAQDLQNMLTARGIHDDSEVIGVARISGNPSATSVATVTAQCALVSSMLPAGSDCYTFHQSVSTCETAAEMQWTSYADGKSVVVCKRLDRLVRHPMALLDLMHCCPELWIIVLQRTKNAPPPKGDDKFLAFQLKELIVHPNMEPSPLQRWVEHQLSQSVGFIKSATEGSRPSLDEMYAVAKSKIGAEDHDEYTPRSDAFRTNAELFHGVSMGVMHSLAKESDSPPAIVSLGPFFLPTNGRWLKHHMCTSSKVVATRRWVPDDTFDDFPRLEVAEQEMNLHGDAFYLYMLDHFKTLQYTAESWPLHQPDKTLWIPKSATSNGNWLALDEEDAEDVLDFELGTDDSGLEEEAEEDVEEEAEEETEEEAEEEAEEEDTQDGQAVTVDSMTKSKQVIAEKRKMLRTLRCMVCGKPAQQGRLPGLYGATCGFECANKIASSIGCAYPMCQEPGCTHSLPALRSSKSKKKCKTHLGEMHNERRKKDWNKSKHGPSRYEELVDPEALRDAIGEEHANVLTESNFARRVLSETFHRYKAPTYKVFNKCKMNKMPTFVKVDEEIETICREWPALFACKKTGAVTWLLVRFPGLAVQRGSVAIDAEAAFQEYQDSLQPAKDQGYDQVSIQKLSRKGIDATVRRAAFPLATNWDEIEKHAWMRELMTSIIARNKVQGELNSGQTKHVLQKANVDRKRADEPEWTRDDCIKAAETMVPAHFLVKKYRKGTSGKECTRLEYRGVVVREKYQAAAAPADTGVSERPADTDVSGRPAKRRRRTVKTEKTKQDDE